MTKKLKHEPYIWDDESGEPCPMTLEEFDARLEASNARLEQENALMLARYRELEERLVQAEALLAQLQAKTKRRRRLTH